MVAILVLLIVIILGNGWHLARLTSSLNEKLGEAAFSVSRNTVESVLSQRIAPSKVAQQIIIERLNNLGETKVIDASSINFKDLQIAQEVELTLNNRSESRSITLLSGNQTFNIPIPRTELEESLDSATDAIIFTSLATLFLAALFFYFLSDRLTRPLKEICLVSAKIGSGEFHHKIPELSSLTSKELKELVQSINQMSQHLTSLEQEKIQLQEQKTTNEISEIVRGIAHSIRNPLHTMLLSLDTIPVVSDNATGSANNFIDLFKAQIQRIDQCIRELMSITTHESLISESTDISKLVEELVIEHSGKHEITIKNHLPEAHKNVRILYSEIKSCLNTLLSNAIEASHKTKQPIVIDLSYANNHWEISLTDFGEGVTKEILPDLFSPHITNKSYGAGMGLYIAKRIITGRYRGNILYCPNSIGAGSKFTLIFNNRIQ